MRRLSNSLSFRVIIFIRKLSGLLTLCFRCFSKLFKVLPVRRRFTKIFWQFTAGKACYFHFDDMNFKKELYSGYSLCTISAHVQTKPILKIVLTSSKGKGTPLSKCLCCKAMYRKWVCLSNEVFPLGSYGLCMCLPYCLLLSKWETNRAKCFKRLKYGLNSVKYF